MEEWNNLVIWQFGNLAMEEWNVGMMEEWKNLVIWQFGNGRVE
jgi:hypothetical protein